MIITKIETIRLELHPNLIWVRLYTDEGVTGLGETWFGTGPVEADIHERIAEKLLGEDPSRIEKLNQKLRPYVGFCGTSAEIRACSAIDVALWDIAGKIAGKPVCDLLGGRTRERIQVYNTCAGPGYDICTSSEVKPAKAGSPADDTQACVYEDLQGFLHSPEELAASLLEMGIHAMKIWPFDFTDGAVDGMDITTADLAKALKPFEEIRERYGDKMRLKAELHGLWGLPAAKKIVSALEPIGMDWIEDPIWMDRISELGELVKAVDVPIAGGETLGGLGQVKDLLQQRAITTPIIDVTWGGGITFAKKAAAMAEAYGKPIAFHDCSGPVTLASSTHLALVCPNVIEQEITRGYYYGWYHELVTQAPPLKDGFITVPEAPGLGLELLPEVSQRADARVHITENGS